MIEDFILVAKTSEIAEYSSKAFDIDGENILLCNTSEGFFAVKNQCTHQLQELEGGKIRRCFIFCPLHGQRFNLKDGAPIGDLTDKPLPTFAVKVIGENVYVNPNAAAQD
jgi:3-phenylpropionate/trans-cinnamate dioxygenase ferredoxin subunit